MLEQPDIRRLVRQRHPILLLDRVTRVDAPDSLVAVKAVTVSEPCYAHLGDTGVAEDFAYPLALLIESFGQAVSVLWALGGTDAGAIPLLAGLRDVAAPAPVLPGDVLEHHVRLAHRSSASWTFTGTAQVAGREVLRIGALLVVARPSIEPVIATRSSRGPS
jgi:3-hydroxyacyl-[acyl-carrier-protein] dehydratase